MGGVGVCDPPRPPPAAAAAATMSPFRTLPWRALARVDMVAEGSLVGPLLLDKFDNATYDTSLIGFYSKMAMQVGPGALRGAILAYCLSTTRETGSGGPVASNNQATASGLLGVASPPSKGCAQGCASLSKGFAKMDIYIYVYGALALFRR